jgi:hypothetical protein
MIRAYRLSTGPHGDPEILRGIARDSEAPEHQAIEFECPGEGSSAPGFHSPYAITVASVIEFALVDGEVQRLPIGNVLILEDCNGPGQEWRLMGDDCLDLAYQVFEEYADAHVGFDPMIGE